MRRGDSVLPPRLSQAGLGTRSRRRREINFNTVRVTSEWCMKIASGGLSRPFAGVCFFRACMWVYCVVFLYIALPVSGYCLRTQDVPGIQELQLCFQAQLFQAQADECQAHPRLSVHRNLRERKMCLFIIQGGHSS